MRSLILSLMLALPPQAPQCLPPQAPPFVPAPPVIRPVVPQRLPIYKMVPCETAWTHGGRSGNPVSHQCPTCRSTVTAISRTFRDGSHEHVCHALTKKVLVGYRDAVPPVPAAPVNRGWTPSSVPPNRGGWPVPTVPVNQSLGMPSSAAHAVCST